MEYIALGIAITTTLFIYKRFNQLKRVGQLCYVTIILTALARAFDQKLIEIIFACTCIACVCYDIYKTGDYKIKPEANEVDETEIEV